MWHSYPIENASLKLEGTRARTVFRAFRICVVNLQACRSARIGLPKMKVAEKDVAYVADLANLELTPAERERMQRDLNSILEYVDRLNELDTSNVPPMAQVAHYGTDESKAAGRELPDASREDILEGLRKSLPHDVALQNAPDSDGTFFKVPKVIER